MNVLFITRRATRCGVSDYGKRVFSILKRSTRIRAIWGEVSDANDQSSLLEQHRPDAVLYNYYPIVLPWVTDGYLAPWRAIPHIAIFHEVGLSFSPNGIIDIDSTKTDDPANNYFVSPRPLFDFSPPLASNTNPIPKIGSFGFGFADKNFPMIAYHVCTQFDQAVLRLNIPFAEFGDPEGVQARAEVEKAKHVIASLNPNIQLEVNHEFIEQQQMLDWLHENDLNVFLYASYDKPRSLSSTIDYALSVRKPICISTSSMFRHVAHVTPSILVTQNTFAQIIRNGIEPLESLYASHHQDKLIAKYEQAISHILGRA